MGTYFKTERELQLDLAEHLRRAGYLTFTEIEIKTVRGGRADVVAVKPSYANKDCRIYEVKNSRNTFQNDDKYEKYLDVCHRMYIACPKGMISKEEIPPNIGLIVRGDNGWYVVKAPKKNHPKDFNVDFLLSLLHRGFEESRVQRKLRDRIVAEDNFSLKKQAYMIGYELARRLDRDRETQVEEWVEECARIFKEYIDVDINVREKLPNLCELEYILGSLSGTLKEVNNIRKIGEYLFNLRLEEDEERFGRGGLKELRDKAMRNIL